MAFYQKKRLQEFIPWTPDLPMGLVSVSEADRQNGSPKKGDMVGLNPEDATDMWLVAAKFFVENYLWVTDV